ncbi:MAG: hypothetical protein KatS3mg127_0413 [Silanimonas sp.]|nr:MAG: hypothetical protein KatS3mg127_0413 [Silanimonas sp.]
MRLNDGPTRPAEVECIEAPAWLPPREPPVRVRKTVPDAWLRLTIREGRNRQVRRMTAAVGLPTLRLVREAIGPYRLDGLAAGAWREETPPTLPERLHRSGAPRTPTTSSRASPGAPGKAERPHPPLAPRWALSEDLSAALATSAPGAPGLPPRSPAARSRSPAAPP